MQPSHYLKAYPLEDAPGQYLLYSPTKGALTRIHARFYRDLQDGVLPSSVADVLARLGMLVESPAQEKQSMLGLFDWINANNRTLNLMVVLNLDCNFACVYCYEGTMKGRHYMSQQTADQLMDFIRHHLNDGKRDLRIDFYGGEPLLSMPRIRQIASAAGDFARSKGASFAFSLVSNGSLLTRRTAEELIDLGLERAKITLDGPAEWHNRSRPYRSGAGSFETIITNILETWDLVKVAIGGNYEKHTFPAFVSLLDDLEKVGLTPDRISSVKFDPVMSLGQTEFALPDYKGGCVSISEPWLIEAEAFLREEILKRGYRTQKIRPVTCMVDVKDTLVVHYDGTIYKCPGFIGHKGFEAGDLEHGLIDYGTVYHTGYWKNEQCSDCGYLPLCFGGCRYVSFLRDGKIGALECRKPYLDAALETLVKQDARYATKLQKYKYPNKF